nr:TSUP family transporter [Synechococcus sp. GFB01]
MLVPWLILLGTGLLALQEPLRGWLLAKQNPLNRHGLESAATLPVFLVSIYGGYFGAGLSVILLAVLAVLLNDSLTRLNGLKQGLALQVNLAAALLFVASGRLDWSATIVMALGSSLGGLLGGDWPAASARHSFGLWSSCWAWR